MPPAPTPINPIPLPHPSGPPCPICTLPALNLLHPPHSTSSAVTIPLDQLDFEVLTTLAPKCDLCKLLVELRDHWNSDAADEKLPLSKDGFSYMHMCENGRWWPPYAPRRRMWRLGTGFDSILSNTIQTYSITSSPLSQQSIRQYKHWLTTCSTLQTPRYPNQPSSLPTRVIDVNTLRLLDPAPPGHHPYIALSHCWGACRSFLTTRANLAAHKRGFKLKDLPPTFRDAVLVTRALGIEYLWIDSVCIIQGDKEDWENEGSKMAGIYANSTVTVAATGVKDDGESFLVQRPEMPTVTLEIVSSSSPAGHQAEEKNKREREALATKTRSRSRTTTLTISPPPPPSPLTDHLSSRAWCLQERFLSPRILSFTQDIVTWECFSTHLTEDRRDAVNSESLFANRDKKEWLYENWATLVMHYSTRQLTYQSDMLPAVSALVARVLGEDDGHRDSDSHSGNSNGAEGAHDTAKGDTNDAINGRSGSKNPIKDTYLAGHFLSTLLPSLLWFGLSTKPPRPPPVRSTTYHAPSWSWASYPGTVGFKAFSSSPSSSNRKINMLDSIQLIEASVDVPGKNPFGTVAASRLRLRTPMLQFTPIPKELDAQAGKQEVVERDYELFEKHILHCSTSHLAIPEKLIAVSFDYSSEKDRAVEEDHPQIFFGIPLSHQGGAIYSRYHVADGTLREGATQDEVDALAMIHGILTRRKTIRQTRKEEDGGRSDDDDEGRIVLERVGCFQIGWTRLDDFVDGLGKVDVEECMIV